MRVKSSAEICAANGMAWNQPNHQHRASPREFKTIRHGDGTLDRQPYDEIEGYDGWEVGLNPRRAVPKPKFVEAHKPAPSNPEARLRVNRILRATPRKQVIRVR